MRKIHLLPIAILLIFTFSVRAQDNTRTNNLLPYVGFFYGGCDASLPISFIAGVQQPLKKNFSISYDIHYWNTNYESYCDDKYSKGHFSSFTPSVKLIFNTGKRTFGGLFAGVGIGYMIAKDRGIEQSYTLDKTSSNIIMGKDVVNGTWNFNSISPSFIFGVGFRVLHLPISITNTYYFAQTTEGFGPAAGGIGLKVGLRKL